MRFRFPPWALTLAFLGLFALLNYRAYQGYFSEDDLDNLSWTSYVGIGEFARGFVDPKVSPHNFRPAGHIYFWVLSRLAGESFPPYVAVIHALHLTNAALLWFLLARMGFQPAARWIAVFIWTFHFALFDAVWKPMYIFDVTCGLFCLLTFHAWVRGRWLLAIPLFWCAYKSKEVALFLPAALALYELAKGRRWKTLTPLFAISASFGLQALTGPSPPPDYAMHFNAGAFRTTSTFYFQNLGGLYFLALLFLGFLSAAEKRWWSLVGALLMMIPLLALPGRLFAVYLYVPLLVAAPAFAIQPVRPVLTAALLGVWAFHDHRALRPQWRAYLPKAREHRSYITQLGSFVRENPHLTTLIYDSKPEGMNSWGIDGAIHWMSRNPKMDVRFEPRPENPPPGGTAIVSWDRENRRVIAIIGL